MQNKESNNPIVRPHSLHSHLPLYITPSFPSTSLLLFLPHAARLESSAPDSSMHRKLCNRLARFLQLKSPYPYLYKGMGRHPRGPAFAETERFTYWQCCRCWKLNGITKKRCSECKCMHILTTRRCTKCKCIHSPITARCAQCKRKRCLRCLIG
jgi:hypothetical protein